MKRFKRVFVIVMDSVGIGAMSDADKFNDKGANTLVHVSLANNGLNIPNMNKLGLNDLDSNIKGTFKVDHPHSYCLKLNEASNGKDTMTGHWEMMGILTSKPFKTFTDTGFPQDLINELEEKTGRKIVGNCAASGTEIIKQYGEHQMKTGDLIVYTSSDSVLQIAAHEEIIPVSQLYHYCEIAREICLRPEYLLGRIIARPYVGTSKDNFKRTSNRHDYALSPTGRTYMDILKDNNFSTICVGKISDIFNGVGVGEKIKTVSNKDGMEKTIQVLDRDFTGLCFVNLVEFDSEYGHRRNPVGYAKCLEEFDEQLGEFISKMNEDDLLMVTADHGNDPIHSGSDHTREMVPLLIYSKSLENGREIETRNSFGYIGRTIIENFSLKPENQIGEVINEVLNDEK
ncbi:MAG: phosphopentomutase [Bacilli bacterium]|nr:phosphopentomutase [Bacillales bacterium]MDY2574513.1 phosphopentomutase [Bacilli bacterium]